MLQEWNARRICPECPCRSPFKADPENLQRAKELVFDLPLDPGIRKIVEILLECGVETFESCEGGPGHACPEPTVKFEGDLSEGLRAVAVALAYGLPVAALRRTWQVRDRTLHGPWWEMTFTLPRPEEIAK